MAFLIGDIEDKLRLKQNIILFVGLILLLLILNSVVSPRNKEFAFADTLSLSGYAWSDNIGWVSLSGSGYGVSVDSSDNLLGYAWSDNIGWIQFGGLDTGSMPSGSGTQKKNAQINGNSFKGWIRALSNGGGWDGWISLSGAGYGVSQSPSTAALSGYAWGSDVVGWLDFSTAVGPSCTPVYSCSGTDTILYKNAACQISTYATCTLPTFCSSGSSTCLYPQPTFTATQNPDLTGHLQLLPELLSSGETTQLHWNVNNVTSCTVTGTNGQSWSGASAGCNGASCYSGASGKTSSAILGQVAYTLTCTTYPGVTPATTPPESKSVNIIPIFQEI